MESISVRIHQTCPFGWAWATLLYVLFFGSARHPNSRAWAQAECGVTRAMPIRVQNATGVDILRAAANCTGGGSLEADWAGGITLDTPVSIASGVFLSITGEDTLAEVRGGSQTRMFDVSRGGGLTLTQLKLSGGTEGSGGAIYSDSAALVFISCTFHGNVATDGDGGAVWADGGNVTIIGGEFGGNNASVYGGAVAAPGARLVVQEGSIFEGNTALAGGALYFSGVADSGLVTRATSCSLSDAEFTSNTATGENEDASGYDFSEGVDGGGGAVAFLSASSANVTDSVFGGNHAQHSGGALMGGNGTDITINGCKFENNTAVEYGGAIAAATMTLGGNTQLSNNSADGDGGAVLGWDPSGTIIFNDVICTQNVAGGDGGCFYTPGKASVNNGTVMHDNKATDGGCIYGFDGCELVVFGGNFRCQAGRRAGFLYGSDQCSVKITGGLMANNVAGRRAGAVYAGGQDGSTLTIEGGTFVNNTALESGGVLAVRSDFTSVEITGGTFSYNSATLNSGLMFLDEMANFTCEEVTVRDNTAGNQGGGIYARDATWMNSSCDVIANQAPQGTALYLAGCKSVTLNNHAVTDNLAFSGSVLYSTESSVVATGVTFKLEVELQEDASNRAIQSVTESALTLKECVFDGWLGDTVIYHTTTDADSLFLDSCDFRASSAAMAVFSLNSDAEIRNAVVGDITFANPRRLNNSLPLVNRALDCSSSNICGPGECVNSTLGVLCACLDDDTCVNDGGGLSLVVETPPANETYSPDEVSFELVVSSAGDGTTYAIWDMTFEADDLKMDVTPSSGILPPGGTVTIAITGTPTGQDVGGDLTSRFNLTSVGSTGSSSIAGVTSLEVSSTFYLCSAFEYAMPLANKISGVSCEQCETLEGWEGVDCESPGATLASLPIRQGYWRSSRGSRVVHKCFHSQTCAGRTEVSSADDYCRGGYKGPYCAVCSEGYGRGVSNTCYSCDNSKGQILIAVGALVSMVVLLLLVILVVVFLIGGLDAVDIVRQSVTRNVLKASKASQRRSSSQTTRTEYPSGTTVAAFDDDCNAGHSGRASPSTRPGPGVAGGVHTRPTGAVADVGTGVGLSNAAGRHGDDAGIPASRYAQTRTVADEGVGGAQANEREGLEANDDGKPKSRDLGETIKRWASRLPLDKLKIVVVVWQILTVSSSITGVEFPASYTTFLSWINIVNLDIGRMASASCVLPSVNFYTRLLVTTLTPLVLAAGLVLTYRIARHRADMGSAGVVARGAAWSRHVAAGLLLTFLVFTSASTLAFETFACDDEVGDGDTYLRADYSISCKSDLHVFFKGYAMLMILVYPIGIPSLYLAVLWSKRDLLNPRIHTVAVSEPDRAEETATTAEPAGEAGIISVFRTATKGHTKVELSPQELQELEERVNARTEHPELAPSMFLWKDFAPYLFYYEAIECGRRMLLTGALIFVAPHSSTQTAMACIFAFVSLLGFELMRPHLDPVDARLYRLGCVVIFLSNFLALLIKVDAAGEENRSALGGLLVTVNVLLVLAVLFTSWFAVQQSVNDSRSEDNAFNVARTMLTAERTSSRIIRSTREQRATVSSAPLLARHEIPPFARPTIRRHAGLSRVTERGGAGGVTTGEYAAPAFARK